MELPPKYTELFDGEAVDSWPVYAYLPNRAGYLAAIEAEQRLRACTSLHVDDVVPVAEREFALDQHWEFDVSARLHEGDDPWHLRVFIAPALQLDFDHLEWDGFTDSEREESLASRWRVGVCGAFGDRPAEDFHIVLKLLCTVCPSIVAVYDEASYRVHSGAWAIDAAQSDVPPALDLLFSVLKASPESEETEGKFWWLHTHGLLRAGCIELEALEVPAHQADLIASFVAQVAAMFLEGGVPSPDKSFVVGEKLELIWLPWEKAIERLPHGHLGTGPDRDETHSGPSGALFVPAQGVKRRRYLSLSSCVPTLERSPIYYVPESESTRASHLAREKLAKFIELHRRYRDQQGWVFAVKLAFEVDDANAPKDEHLWFEVHDIDQRTVDATLLNEPILARSMHEGDRDRHSLKRLIDWAISSPHGDNFSPERLYHLLRLLPAADGAGPTEPPRPRTRQGDGRGRPT